METSQAWHGVILGALCAMVLIGIGALEAGQAAGLSTAPLATQEPQEPELQNCTFITNDCEVCMVEKDGKPSCSSTGIACVPTRRWCLVPATK